IVVDVSKDPAKPTPMQLVNPEIVWASDELSDYEEGCLSLPDHYAPVTRPAHVRVRYLDRAGAQQEVEAKGLLAVCLQHEMDHLEGKLFIDRLSFLKSNKIKNRITKHGYPTPEEAEEEREEARSRRKDAQGLPNQSAK
ncbi:MAG: peptide deformylase, partial [Bdellovibrionota bacterium]